MNKFRQVQIPLEAIQEAARDSERVPLRMHGGLILDQTPQDMPLVASPALDTVRVEQGALRGDYAVATLGTPATSAVLALGEHRFVQVVGGALVESLFRVTRNGSGFAEIETYDEDTGTWTSEVTGAFSINSVFLSWISIFGAVFFADGDRVFRWDRSDIQEDEGDDFGAGNSITLDSSPPLASLTVNPGAAVGDRYRLHFSLTVDGPSTEEGSVTIAVLHNGAEVTTKTYPVPYDGGTLRSLSFPHEIITIYRENIALNDTVSLFLKSASRFPLERLNVLDPVDGPTNHDFQDLKAPDVREAWDDKYQYEWTLSYSGGSFGHCVVEIYYDVGGGWVLWGDIPCEPGFNTVPVTVDGMSTGSGFRVLWVSGDAGTWTITDARVKWQESFDVTLHGFNQATDLDPSQGITYSTTGQPINDLAIVEEEPGLDLEGRFVSAFAGRLIVLRQDDDPQKIIWSEREDPLDYTGLGAGQQILSSHSDPIDELMALVPINANVAALFRKNSIWRVVETGNSLLPLAFFPWIEELGTESPFSIAQIPGGLLFFGNDKRVYFLTETGHQAVSDPIDEQFDLELTRANLEFVEGVFHPVANDYILTYPL